MKKISIENLYQYMEALKEEPGLSLCYFIGDIADFSEIIFDESHQVDLRGANLSDCRLNGANFNEFVKLKGADLRGALLEGSMFTDQTDLSGVKFGYLDLELHAKVFKNCRLENAEYTPSDKAIKEVAVTEKMIENFRKHGAGKSLNEYLSGQGQNKGYQKIIADFSEYIVDERCNDLNLSGSKFVGTIFRGRIKGIELRDCLFDRIKPSYNVVLEKADLRGTCLTEGRKERVEGEGYVLDESLVGVEGFRSIAGYRDLTLVDPIVSLASDQHSIQYKLEGKIKFDPCYKRGSNGAIKELKKGTLEDLKRQDVTGFDFSNMDLRDSQLEGKTFTNCSFAHCQLSGASFKESHFHTCNFNAADLSKKGFGFWRRATDLQDVEAYDCDFSSADLTGVDARNSQLVNLLAINVTANGYGWEGIGGELRLGKSANDANFTGAYIPGVKAIGMEAARANFSGADCDGGDFTKAKLYYANFYQTSLIHSTLNKTELNNSRFAANVSKAYMVDTVIDGADLAGLFYEKENEFSTTVRERIEGLTPAVRENDGWGQSVARWGIKLISSKLRPNKVEVKNLRGQPIESEETLSLKVMQAKQDIQRVKRKTDRRAMLALVVISLVVAIAAPYTLPVIVIAANYTAAALFGAYAVDMITQGTLGVSKVITDNTPGVSQIKERINAPVIAKSEEEINQVNERKKAVLSQRDITDDREVTNPESPAVKSKREALEKERVKSVSKSAEPSIQQVKGKVSDVGDAVSTQRGMKPSIEARRKAKANLR